MKTFGMLAVLLLVTAGLGSQAPAPETKVRWFGHAAFAITSPRGKVLLIDPSLKNPLNPDAKDG